MLPLSPTRCAARTGPHALCLLALTLAATGWCLGVALFPQPKAEALPQGGTDLHLYRSIVARVHAGESYYAAAGRELRAHGYPTGSIFNWRTPGYAWLIGSLPSPAWAQGLLILLALAALLTAYGVMQQEGGTGRAVAGVLLLLGAFLWCVDGDAFYAQELWAGTLIALSVGACARGCRYLGLAAGLAALFFRELALPYCVIALALAWRQRRRTETCAWLVGLFLYSLFLSSHAVAVASRLTAVDRSPAGWVQFGGPAFLLATCRMNAFLFRLPCWASALYLPLALLGLTAWRGETGDRLGLTVGAYVAALAVVGQPFNDYWGLLLAPLLPFGFAWAPAALRSLARAALGRAAAKAAPRSLPAVQ